MPTPPNIADLLEALVYARHTAQCRSLHSDARRLGLGGTAQVTLLAMVVITRAHVLPALALWSD